MAGHHLSPDVALALNYAPKPFRNAFNAVFTLDLQLGGIVSAAKEPRLAAIRLAWWRDQLESLDVAPYPNDPVLQACQTVVQSSSVTGSLLAKMAEGWALLLDDAPDLEPYAAQRGGALFAALADVVGWTGTGQAGEVFALGDLVRRDDDEQIRMAAAQHIVGLPQTRFPRSLRAAALLAHWARIDAGALLDHRPLLTMRDRAISALKFSLFPSSV